MPKHYVTFGASHVHKVNGKLLHSNVVAVYEAESAAEGRQKAFEFFGPKFSFEYHDTEWDDANMKYFPEGYVYL